MKAHEITRWLSTLDENADVCIDDGGAMLMEVEGEAYLEVGGYPDDDRPTTTCRGCGEYFPDRDMVPKLDAHGEVEPDGGEYCHACAPAVALDSET